MAETKARFLANLIGADNTANDFTLPNTAVSGTDNKVLTSGGDGTVTWETTELSPATTSISPTEVASDAGGNITFTLTGTNYALSGMTVHFIATSGSDITSGMTVTHTSATSLSVEIARSAFVDANEPYSVKVIKASGLDHTLSNAVRVDNAPSFTASANTVVATIRDNASDATHATILATDAESDAITFSEVGSTLANEFTGTTKGVQSDGTIVGVPDVVTTESQETTFTVRATSTGDGGATIKTTDQAFKFVITPPPIVFSGKTYNGTGSSNSITFDETYSDNSTARNFQPDLVWMKGRNQTLDHVSIDSVANERLHPNLSNSSASYSSFVSFDSDGFTVTNNSGVNQNSPATSFIAWAFKAGGAPSGTNTNTSGAMTANSVSVNGALQSSYTPSGSPSIYPKKMSVNTAGGFSIIQYTKNETAGATLPHGLSQAPELIIVKDLDASNNWIVYHTSLGATKYLILDDDSTGGTNINRWDNTAPSNSVVTLGSGGHVNGPDGPDYIMYCWHSVSGVSAFGSYTANGTSPKVVTNLGFKPRFLMVKCYDTDNLSWHIVDTFRFGGDTGNEHLYADINQAELDTSSHATTFDNDGFTLTGNSAHMNDGSKNYIYMAFA